MGVAMGGGRWVGWRVWFTGGVVGSSLRSSHGRCDLVRELPQVSDGLTQIGTRSVNGAGVCGGCVGDHHAELLERRFHGCSFDKLTLAGSREQLILVSIPHHASGGHADYRLPDCCASRHCMTSSPPARTFRYRPLSSGPGEKISLPVQPVRRAPVMNATKSQSCTPYAGISWVDHHTSLLLRCSWRAWHSGSVARGYAHFIEEVKRWRIVSRLHRAAWEMGLTPLAISSSMRFVHNRPVNATCVGVRHASQDGVAPRDHAGRDRLCVLHVVT